MAVCYDPNGAEFDLWEPRAMLGTDVDSTRPGAPGWFESMTTDVGRAAGFYTGLFGWTSERAPRPGSSYTTFRNGGTDIAGMMEITPALAGLRPHWATYVTVDDADQAAREAVALGARLHVPLRDIPGLGRFCGITSPQGVRFHLIRYSPGQGS